MPDLKDGESTQVQGSARLPYILKNVGGVYSCTCPAWRNQSLPIERRTCKHLRARRGEQAEQERLGALLSKPSASTPSATRTVPNLLLAERWENDIDLAGWWMSETLDGVRAWWTGREFLSRQGNVYHAPDWFVAGLPSLPLDGELWLDRKAFQRTVSIVRRHDQSDHWRQITFVVFDAPAAAGPFENRQAFLEATLREHGPLTFSVGTGFTDAERQHPPSIGSSITFRYQELTDRGVPRFPSFVRVRSKAGMSVLA
ncbi:MAG: hypothetical protein NTY19_39290 [Planctomycetota bacterium]|nr:hypothetical protein [Planctomycetota bacterium]